MTKRQNVGFMWRRSIVLALYKVHISRVSRYTVSLCRRTVKIQVGPCQQTYSTELSHFAYRDTSYILPNARSEAKARARMSLHFTNKHRPLTDLTLFQMAGYYLIIKSSSMNCDGRSLSRSKMQDTLKTYRQYYV